MSKFIIQCVPRLHVTQALDDGFVAVPVICMQTKEEIAKEVQDELSKAFAAFGYEILQALVTDIDPDPRVKAAMNEVRGVSWDSAFMTVLSFTVVVHRAACMYLVCKHTYAC